MSRIAILGAGAWGTALAINLANRREPSGQASHDLILWTRLPEAAQSMRERRQNLLYLPNVPLPDDLQITSNPKEAVNQAEIIVSVTPSEYLRATYNRFAPLLTPDQLIVSATKGIEDTTNLRMSEVIHQALSAHNLNLPIAVLSGPSFAQEVAANAPTALTIASTDSALATRIQKEFSGHSLRLYTNEDVIGVELGGALKNVIAIASGVVAGLNLGHNTAAALITRGIAEITRLAIACGGRRETLAGLSGIGDLVLTCTGALSRNRLVGIELGQGRQLQEILANLKGKVAEGVRTTHAALGLAQRQGAQKQVIEMPITEQMAQILNGNKSPQEAIRELMSRPGRDE